MHLDMDNLDGSLHTSISLTNNILVVFFYLSCNHDKMDTSSDYGFKDH